MAKFYTDLKKKQHFKSENLFANFHLQRMENLVTTIYRADFLNVLFREIRWRMCERLLVRLGGGVESAFNYQSDVGIGCGVNIYLGKSRESLRGTFIRLEVKCIFLF